MNENNSIHSKINIAILGGDRRFIELANHFSLSSYKVFAFGFDQSVAFFPNITVCNDIETHLDKCDLVIFPLPVSNDKINLYAPFSPAKSYSLNSIFKKIKQAKAIFGGKVSLSVEEILKEHNLEIFDYLKREEFAVLNAVPTAEGAIQLALEELDFTLSGSKCLISGYGRISKVLAKILISMGAIVTITARKYDQLAWAKIDGCKTLYLKSLLRTNEIESQISNFDVIFNTIPYNVFDKNFLKSLKKNCLIIDLASFPGGFDLKSVSDLSLRIIEAQGLPGKVAPITSGKIIMDTVINICNELELQGF